VKDMSLAEKENFINKKILGNDVPTSAGNGLIESLNKTKK